MKQLVLLKIVFDALLLKYNFPPLILTNNETTFHLVQFQRVLTKLNYKYKHVHIDQAMGFYMCHYKKLQLSVGIVVF